MAVGRAVENRGGHIDGFVEEIRARNKDLNAFFTFFSGGEDAQNALARGNWDFSTWIAAPVFDYLRHAEKMTALEIGCGGGRLLAAASRHFAHVVGVDIHDSLDLVRDFLSAQGIHNVELKASDGRKIPLESGSVDFIYSFVVMQHMELIEIFRANIGEIARVLRPGGFGIVYVGRVSRLCHNTSSRLLYLWDRIYEESPFCPPYIERSAKVNETNLMVSVRHARKCLAAEGLELIRVQFSGRESKECGKRLWGGQSGLIIHKPK